MRLSPNTILQNRYYIHQLIGQGSMGAVYRATDQRLDIDVAVKQIVRRDAASQQAFAHEARLLAKLRHPALPKVLDYFTDETDRFLVMEYIPGPDLSKALLRRVDPFPLTQVLDWGKELLAVLTYLHEQQPAVIHRDVKPANLKLAEQERLMLLDFGLAQRPFPYPDDLAIGYTQHYAPPEQIRGQAVDARSDLYALAATLYDLATGVKPPDAVQQRQSALAAGQPDPLQPAHERQPTISAAIAGVLQQAMALDPSERYASARDMQLALEDARRRQTAVPHNLPAQVTPFVGRRQMMRTVRQQLVTEDARLLTLTGPGGVGKTRLGLQIAAALRENFPDGVFFVPLASLRDPDLVVSAVAQALGVKESGGQSLRAAVQEQLMDKQTLLLLDNFEHLLDAALLVAGLLANCPRLKVLVTSRSLLQLRGEHRLPVRSLSLPDRDGPLTRRDVLQYTAVQLFVQRAQAAASGFELDEGNVTAVAEICRRLDGLPLAIELAAAHVRTLSPAQILDRLTEQFDLLRGGPRDLPPRQQALRATLDWSYDLLNPAEKMLFRRLAVFAGGWTLDAATAVCQPAADDLAAAPLTIEDGLASLIDKNLVQQTRNDSEPRYSMLVTVHAYAAEKMAASGEANILRQKHAAYFQTWAEEVRPKLVSAAPEKWLNRLEIEHNNLRAVLQWALDHNVTVGFRLGDALWRFWQAHNHRREGRSWLDKLLAQDTTPTIDRVMALSAAGNLAIDQGDTRRANALHEESLTLSRQLGNKYWESIGLNNLAIGWMSLGDYEETIQCLEKSLTLSREVGHTTNVGHTLNNLGVLALQQGRYQQATEYLEESLATFRQQADKRAICLPLSNLGQVAGCQGAYEKAATLLREALVLSEALNDKWLMAHNWRELGKVFSVQGDQKQAVDLLEKSLSLFTEIENTEGRVTVLNLLAKVACDTGKLDRAATLSETGLDLSSQISNKAGTAVSLQNLATVALRQQAYDSAAQKYRQALGLFNELKHRLNSVVCLEGLAAVANRQGQAKGAARFLSAADAWRNRLGAPLPPVDRPHYGRTLTAVRTTLGEGAFTDAWAEGQAMSLETAVAYALQEKE